jgi:hypothetical protein
MGKRRADDAQIARDSTLISFLREEDRDWTVGGCELNSERVRVQLRLLTNSFRDCALSHRDCHIRANCRSAPTVCVDGRLHIERNADRTSS